MAGAADPEPIREGFPVELVGSAAASASGGREDSAVGEGGARSLVLYDVEERAACGGAVVVVVGIIVSGFSSEVAIGRRVFDDGGLVSKHSPSSSFFHFSTFPLRGIWIFQGMWIPRNLELKDSFFSCLSLDGVSVPVFC